MAATAEHVIVASKGEVRGLTAATGQVAWTEQVGPLTAPPVTHGDALILATGEQLSAHRLADGSRTWTRSVGVVDQKPSVSDGRLYVPVSDGKLIVLNLASGEPVWEKDVGIEPTEPLVDGGRVFFGSAAKKFCSVRADTGEEIWCFSIGAAVVGAPVTDGTRVYFVALDNQLHAHDRNNGARRWKKSLGYRPSSGPSIVGRTVSAPGREAKLQAFDTVTGAPGAQLALPATMVEPPVLFPSVDGRAGEGCGARWRAREHLEADGRVAAAASPARSEGCPAHRTARAGGAARAAASSSRIAADSRRTPSSIRSGVGAENERRMKCRPLPFTKNASPDT